MGEAIITTSNQPRNSSSFKKVFFAKENKLSEVVIWGTGAPLREFLHVDDCADAIITLLQKTVSNDLINIGSGQDISIKELARLVSGLIGFSGSIDENYRMAHHEKF